MTVLEARGLVIDRMLTAQRLAGGYRAEADGLLRALYCKHPGEYLYCTEPDQRARYLMGFRDGRTILEVAARATDPRALVTAGQEH